MATYAGQYSHRYRRDLNARDQILTMYMRRAWTEQCEQQESFKKERNHKEAVVCTSTAELREIMRKK